MDSLGGYVSYGRYAFATQLVNAARAAALQEEGLRRRMARNQNLWNVAQQAEQDSDLRVAARLYQRVALSRPRTEVTVAAQQRLAQIQAAAQTRFDVVENQLDSLTGRGSTNSDSQNVPSALKRIPSASQIVNIDTGEVTRLFAELDKLILEYAGVDSIEVRLKERADRLRRHKLFAAALQEPAASQLWKLGQEHEQQQKLCCAFLAYEQAANLAPAPSGEKAKVRVRELQASNKSIVAEADQCKNLQLCHEKYRRAMALKQTLPESARKYLAEILELAAPDTSVHQAAREQIAMLP
jgi:hypothetical protein